MRNIFMRNILKNSKLPLTAINLACVLALLIIITPLLLVAKYNYPSADDWSYGITAYQTLKAGGNFLQVLSAAAERAKEAYFGWDGRFANCFLDALQPGIWGEQYYSLTSWILIGALIFSELVFFRFLICFQTENRDNAMLWIPIAVPVLIIQILFSPSPVEAFYWYTGGMNYSFMYGLSLILTVLFIRLGVRELAAKPGNILTAAAACVLSVFVGGGNFSTSLATLLTLCSITAIFLMRKKFYFLRRTWYVTLAVAVCLIVCLKSPGSIAGNSSRMIEAGNPLPAVGRSLAIAANQVLSWTFTGEVLLMALFILPFLLKAAANLKTDFRFPLLFSLLTFGIYAAQMMPNIYTTGFLGGGRQIVILKYSYMIWLVVNLLYWIGWVQGIRGTGWSARQRRSSLPLLIYCSVVGIILVSYLFIFQKKELSCYKAYRDWKQGWAQQYAAEWEERLEILRDDSVKEAVFHPISVYPEVLMYADLQTEDDYLWVNEVCSQYYDKNFIQVNGF